jgi:hypothetical protein
MCPFFLIQKVPSIQRTIPSMHAFVFFFASVKMEWKQVDKNTLPDLRTWRMI